MKRCVLIMVVMLSAWSGVQCLLPAEGSSKLSEHIRLIDGPINSVVIEKDDHRLVVYGAPVGEVKQADMVLFTHSRRDVAWAGTGLVRAGAAAVVPVAEADSFAGPEVFWQAFTERRYNDAQQQTTKVLTRSLNVSRTVKQGDKLEWHGLDIHVIDTPGYTRGAVCYLVTVDGCKYAFVGDLIYGNGQLLDLYSLQDAIPEAKIGHYHGWAGRMAPLIQSLRRLKAQNPDILVPARGPVIRNPNKAIDLLIQRLQAVYRNYLSINAGRWYFKDSYDILAKQVLGDNPEVPWMDWAIQIDKAPADWVVPIHNARLILSKTGRGFLIDCGSQGIIDELVRLRDQGKLEGLDGVFITHYHADHTHAVPDLLKVFPAPAYACPPSDDILIRPGAYRLPVISVNAVPNLRSVPDGHKMQWHEFNLTFYDFPGQTIYHDALLVEKESAGKMLFVGDSFTPSGLDDYCLLNRNLIHDGTGYLCCLDVLRKMPDGCLLNNQHVLEPFRFSPEQIDHMESVYRTRKQLLAELFPWDEPNYGIDERWARFYPYGQTVQQGRSADSAIVIFNHSSKPQLYKVRLHAPKAIRVEPKELALTVPPRTERKAHFKAHIQPDAKGVCLITADISFNNFDLRRWAESMIEVTP